MTDWIRLPIINEPAKFQEFQSLLVPEVFIAGGAARFAASTNEKPAKYSDIDLFGTNSLAIADMFNKLSSIAELKSETPMSYLFLREHTLDGTTKIVDRFNLIRLFCGTLENVLEEFDFSVSRAGIVGNEVLVDPAFETDEKEKRLRIQHIHCPVSTMFRAAKYQAKGYKFPLVEMLKLFSDWERRPEEYRIRLVELASDPSITEEGIAELEALLRID